MLVKPSFRRHDDRTGFPVDPRNLLALGPKQRITLAGKDEDMGARAMAMSFLVKTDRKARHMRAHHALGHFKKDGRVAFAALGPLDRLDIDNVGDKVGFDHPVVVKLAAAGKKSLFALKPLGKRIRTVGDEIGATEQIENQWRRGHRQQPRFLVPLAVKMLIPGVERHGEQAAGLPLERLLGAILLPDSRRAAPGENVDQRFVDMALRIEAFTRRDADDVSVVHVAGAVEHDAHTVAADAIPPFQ